MHLTICHKSPALAFLTGFTAFWAKRVTGFDPQAHGPKCLLGPMVAAVHKNMRLGRPCTLAGQAGAVVYLYGICAPYRAANNVHLALRAKPCAQLEVKTFNGFRLHVAGAELLPVAAPDAATCARGKAYARCRIYHFGAQHGHVLGLAS